jgi:hypothetical protein
MGNRLMHAISSADMNSHSLTPRNPGYRRYRRGTRAGHENAAYLRRPRPTHQLQISSAT